MTRYRPHAVLCAIASLALALVLGNSGTPAPAGSSPCATYDGGRASSEDLDTTSSCWNDARPVPEGFGLVGHAIGPAHARDPFHVDWEAFCRAHARNCDASGDPDYAPGDAAMIANTLPVSPYDAGITYVCTGARVVAFDKNCGDQVGVYYGTANDPLVKISVAGTAGYGPGGTSGTLNGASLHIPAGAIAQLPHDSHMNVHQPDGSSCEFWQTGYGDAAPKPVAGPVLRIYNGGCVAANLEAEGTYAYEGAGAAYAARDEMTRGLVRAEDIAGNNGDGTDSLYPDSFSHAVYGSFTNNRQGTVWPAVWGDGTCTSANPRALPVEGMYLYLDNAGYEIVRRWNPPVYLRPLRRFLGTLHRHGMLDMDSSGCSATARYVNLLTWGPQAAYQATGTSLFDAYVRNDLAPHDASFAPHAGGDPAVWMNEAGSAYSLQLLYYRDVPGLSASNFHWIAGGCGELAVRGTPGTSSC